MPIVEPYRVSLSIPDRNGIRVNGRSVEGSMNHAVGGRIIALDLFSKGHSGCQWLDLRRQSNLA